MAVTHCEQRARKGVMDLTYIERRLDIIEARIDDLCGLLGSVLEALGVDSVTTPDYGDPDIATADSQDG